jgi:hypothetical protein
MIKNEPMKKAKKRLNQPVAEEQPMPKPLDPELQAMVNGKTPAEKMIMSHRMERWVNQLRASLGFARDDSSQPDFSFN